MSKKIFFFDVDGTIKGFDGISDRVVDAIRNMRKQGNLCFIASGRPPAFISQDIIDVGFDGYILSNGANIIYNDELIFNEVLDYDEIKKIIQYFHKKHIEYVLQTSTKCYIDKRCTHLISFYKKLNANFEKFEFEFDLEEQLHRTNKFEFLPRNELIRKLMIKKLNSFEYMSYPKSCVEVYSKNISKATAIKKVIEMLNINFDDTYCFGDGKNDIEMFMSVAHSFAMANANDEVKAKAKNICPSIKEDGVAVILEQL